MSYQISGFILFNMFKEIYSKIGENEKPFNDVYDINPQLFKLFSKESLPIYCRGISFDIDGVIADSAVPVVGEVNKFLGANYTTADIDSYDWVYRTLRHHKVKKDEAQGFQKWVWEDPEILNRSPLIPGAQEMINLFYDMGQRPYFITTRIPALQHATSSYLEMNLEHFNRHDLYIRDGSEKDANGIDYKIRMINLHNVRLHFEDHLPTVRRITQTSRTSVIVIPFGYNHLSEKDTKNERVYRYDRDERTVWPLVSDIRTLRAAGYGCVAQCH